MIFRDLHYDDGFLSVSSCKLGKHPCHFCHGGQRAVGRRRGRGGVDVQWGGGRWFCVDSILGRTLGYVTNGRNEPRESAKPEEAPLWGSRLPSNQ